MTEGFLARRWLRDEDVVGVGDPDDGAEEGGWEGSI